ncbi:unnamed protein product [Sphagnum tenellum]
MELSKSKNRKVDRFASCQTDSLAGNALHSQTEENSDVVSSSCRSMCRLGERKQQTHNRRNAQTESRNSRCGRINTKRQQAM